MDKKNSKYNTRLNFTRETIVIICHLVKSPFKSMYYQISCKNSCRKTIGAAMIKKIPNESKLIYAINIFIVVSFLYLLFIPVSFVRLHPLILSW